MSRQFEQASNWTVAYRRLTSGWALLAWWLGLMAATHFPRQFQAGSILGIGLDNLVHALLYAPLAWMLLGFLGRRPVFSFWRRHRFAIVLPLLLLAGALDELTQPWCGRTCSLGDWLGDAAGVAVVWIVALLVNRGRT